MESKLTVSGLCYAYEKGQDVLRELSVDFAPGRITALIGANGCGKSTLLNLLAGVFQPESGRILLDGQDIRSMRRSRIARRIAVVHQSNTAPADITVEKLVSLGRTPYRGLWKGLTDADRAAVARAMADTHVEEFADRNIHSLSGGQLQRVWLAMALAQETDILLLDEITTYLDIHYQLELLHLIRELNRAKGMTIIMVLHDINLAFEFCDQVVVMEAGQAIAQGDIAQAATEEVLNRAFRVHSRIVSLGQTRHCIFSREGETYAQSQK